MAHAAQAADSIRGNGINGYVQVELQPAAFDSSLKPYQVAVIADPMEEAWHENMCRGGWIPDSSVLACMICTSQFTFWRRRHHCRRCGAVVCGSCADNHTKFWSKDVQEVKDCEEQRVCDKCIQYIDSIISRRISESMRKKQMKARRIPEDNQEPEKLPLRREGSAEGSFV